MTAHEIQKLPSMLPLGRQREQNVTILTFDLTPWLEKWRGLVCSITHAEGGDPYSDGSRGSLTSHPLPA